MLADWIRKNLERGGREDMAAPAMAVLAAIFIPVGFSLLILRSSSLGLLLGLLGIFFGIGLIRPVLLTTAINTIRSGSWAFAVGLQIGLFELGSWLYLLAAGSVSNFSILIQGIMWAAVCGLLGLLGTTAVVVTAAMHTRKK
jgi:hypothetical protein